MSAYTSTGPNSLLVICLDIATDSNPGPYYISSIRRAVQDFWAGCDIETQRRSTLSSASSSVFQVVGSTKRSASSFMTRAGDSMSSFVTTSASRWQA